CFASRFRFVNWLVFPAAGKTEQCACNHAASDSCEREKIAPGWQQRLHRAIIDTSLVNRVARKFYKSWSDPEDSRDPSSLLRLWRSLLKAEVTQRIPLRLEYRCSLCCVRQQEISG